MPFYHKLGQIPRKRHIAFPWSEGGIHHEQLVGIEGFTGPAELLYHVHPPTTVKAVRRLAETPYEASDDKTLRHRHFRTAGITRGGSPTLDRRPILCNSDIAMLCCAPDVQDEHFYRNAQTDEVVYVAEGEGTLETQYGDLPIIPGDNLVIHRHILHRCRFTKPAKLLVMESRGHIQPPKRNPKEVGQLVEGAPYSEREIRVPRELRTYDEKGDFTLIIKQYDGLNECILDHHPLDVVGWDGRFYS